MSQSINQQDHQIQSNLSKTSFSYQDPQIVNFLVNNSNENTSTITVLLNTWYKRSILLILSIKVNRFFLVWLFLVVSGRKVLTLLPVSCFTLIPFAIELYLKHSLSQLITRQVLSLLIQLRAPFDLFNGNAKDSSSIFPRFVSRLMNSSSQK